ncbi:MAG: NAD-dependent epimerase/dehydratase family protein [Chloroflexi bacterium]|nr:NAD-dependent epimerase/dehydratase family protein [Chloroflexota bacterium]
MRILITGADGFAGQYLLRELASTSAELHGTSFRRFAQPMPNVIYHTVDLRDEQAVDDLMAEVQPAQVYHLAGTANVGQSYTAAWRTLENNIRAQLNLILACLKKGLQPRILVISSGDIYGDQLLDQPATEDMPLRPGNPYSVSKVTQDMLALQYYLSHGLPLLRARPFNHIGVGQSRGFVAPDFAFQIAKIEAGQQPPVMHVGSLSAERDFCDVRDVVRAYHLIMNQGVPGEVYNIASGIPLRIGDLLKMLMAYSQANVQIETDTARLRPGRISKVWGDATRLRQATGWQPTIPLEQTLHEMLDDCRQRSKAPLEDSK